MKYRLATVLAKKSLGATGTETIDINLKDPISRLDIVWKPTLWNDSMARALPSGLTKIELIDGSDVLHSLEGGENQALLLYDRRIQTLNSAMLWSGAEAYAVMGIDFGRFLFDKELAFDPTKFRNPQLKITHDRSKVGAATAVDYLEVYAHCFDEKVISPIGFLSAKNHYTYTPAAEDAYQYIDLPTDKPIRQILVRGYAAQDDPTNVVDEFKLSEDNDKRIPFDINLEDYVNRMRGEWVQLQDLVIEYIDNAETYNKYVTPTDEFIVSLALTQEPARSIGFMANAEGGYLRRKSDGAISAAIGIAIGYLPHHCIQIPFGDQKDIDDWYDVTTKGSVRARLLSAADFSGAEISLILQQLRRY